MLSMKAIVRRQRSLSSAKLASTSGIAGAFIPASRATAFFALSDVLCVGGLLSRAYRMPVLVRDKADLATLQQIATGKALREFAFGRTPEVRSWRNRDLPA